MGNAEAVPYPDQWPGSRLSYLDKAFTEETPQHEVCVEGFWIGRYEVRAAEWHRIMGGKAPSRPNAPVSDVTWEQARTFAARLTERSGGKHRFRLPTEAEWEYACRAGSSHEKVPHDNDLIEHAWYFALEYKRETQEVGKLAPNAFGLYDMLGNVWEWVEDSYVENGYTLHGLFNPVVQAAGEKRVIRGASYRSQPEHVRCAKRGSYDGKASLWTIGFRLVREDR